MKRMRTLLVGAAVLGIAGPVLAYEMAAPNSVAAARATAQAVVHIPTMTCSNKSCETAVYLSLMRTPGVRSVRVVEAAQNVVVQYDPAKTNPSKLLGAVRNAGYPGTLVAPRKS